MMRLKLTTALTICLSLLGLAHCGYGQQASWKFEVLNNNITPAAVGSDLRILNADEAADKWFGPVLEFADPGGIFTIDEQYVDTQSNQGNVSFWMQTSRAKNDATWQPLLTIHPSRNWKEQVTVRLRWNRIIINAGDQLTVDLGDDRALERDQWHHISVNFSPAALQVVLDGVALGEIPLSALDLNIDEPIRVGGDALMGKFSKVNAFSRVLPAPQILELIQRETPARAEGWNDPAPNISRFSTGEISESKGYSVDEIKTYFPEIQQWNQFDSRLNPLKKSTDFAAGRFTAPPAPYQHPRIFFNASDLDSIRQQINGEVTGSYLRKQKFELIRSRCFQLRSTPEQWDAMGSLSGPLKGTHPDNAAWEVIRLPRKGYHGPWVGGWVNDLANGIDPLELSGKWNLPVDNQSNPRQYLMHLLPYEALRCLIDNDVAGGQRIGKALVTICQLFGQHMDEWQGTDNWQQIYQRLGSDSIGVTYDWAYPFMSEADRATVRKFIGDITRGKNSIGFDHLPAFPGTTSNWATIHMHLINLTLSIEGETGYDDAVYQGCVETMRKWCYVATGPQGAPFEGYNKSSYATFNLLPLARRGADFLGTEWVKNAGSKYHLATLLPWGTDHVYEQASGPGVLPRDFTPFKYAYPQDPITDLVYGNIIQAQLGPTPVLEWENIRTTYSPFFPYFLYFDDPIGSTQAGDYDFKKRTDEVLQQLSDAETPTLYYSDYRGLLTSRSSWAKDAAFLLFEPRNVPGGHTVDARNDFFIASHGRPWTYRPKAGNGEGPSEIRNIILIDGIGQGHQCVPGRTVSLQDNARTTIATGDATWAYSFKSGNRDTGIKVEHSPNDSRLAPSTLPWMDQPWNFLPGWLEGKIGGGRHGYWLEHNPIEYSYRTVALVKNQKPYWIVRDDLKKDESAHNYTWLFQVPDDLTVIEPATVNGAGIDLILGDQQNRRLLVRILEMGSGPFATAAIADTVQLKSYEYFYRQSHSYQRLEIPVTDTVGHFTVLLVPFLAGEELPTTAMENQTLTHRTGTQVDRFSLSRDANGMTQMELMNDTTAPAGPVMEFLLDELPDPAEVIDSTGNTKAIIHDFRSGPNPERAASNGLSRGCAWDFGNSERAILLPYADNAQVLDQLLNDTSSNGFSITMRLKMDGSGQSFQRFIGMDGGFEGYQYQDRLLFMLRNPDGSSSPVSGTAHNGNRYTGAVSGVFDGSWKQFTLTADFTTAVDNISIYIDGVLQLTESRDLRGLAPQAGKLLIGARSNYGNPFGGEIDNVSIWTRALSEKEAQGTTGCDAPFINRKRVMDFRLDELPEPAEVIDSTGNARAIIHDFRSGPNPVRAASNGLGEGYAWDFGNSERAILLPYADNAQLLDLLLDDASSNGFSITMRLKMDGSGQSFQRFIGMGGAFEGYQYQDRLLFMLRNPDGSSSPVSGTAHNGNRFTNAVSGVFDGSWKQFTLTADFTTAVDNISIYIDGVLQLTESRDLRGLAPQAGNLLIGARSNYGNYFGGEIDNVSIWTRELDEREVSCLAQQGQPAHERITLDLATSGSGSTFSGATHYSISDMGAYNGETLTMLNLSGESVGTDWLGERYAGYLAASDGSKQYLPGLGGANHWAYALNDQSEVAGVAEDAAGLTHAVVYAGAETFDLAQSGVENGAYGINNARVVVGSQLDAGGNPSPFWSDQLSPDAAGGYQLLPLDGARSGHANWINNSGQVVGWTTDAQGVTRAVLWPGDGSVVDLNTRLNLGSGWFLEQAHVIGEDGAIEGVGRLNGAPQIFHLEPVN